MSKQPEALRLAAVPIFDRSITWQSQATIELRRLAAVEAQRDAMQERAEYWKRKHDDEETGAERHALRVQRDELLSALNAMLTEMGMDEDEWNAPTFDQARAAIAKAQQ